MNIKQAQRVIPTATSDKRARLVSYGTVYTAKGQENRYLPCCAAILDAILELYPVSNTLYSQIITQ